MSFPRQAPMASRFPGIFEYRRRTAAASVVVTPLLLFALAAFAYYVPFGERASLRPIAAIIALVVGVVIAFFLPRLWPRSSVK